MRVADGWVPSPSFVTSCSRESNSRKPVEFQFKASDTFRKGCKAPILENDCFREGSHVPPRYYTFNTHDLAVIRRRRGDHNRLGFAVQLCYVRFPGQLLAVGEPPYAPILAMAAAQLKVPTGIWSFYAERDQTRREHC